MEHLNSRRKFIKTSLTGSALITLGFGTAGEMLSSCSNSAKVASSKIQTGFQQTPLPYAYDALENVVDAKTMEIHYTKHAAAYAKNLNDAVKEENADSSRPLENLLASISKYSTKMRNNAGGHYNHEMFWKCMRSKQTGNAPVGAVANAITRDFGSFEAFKKQFSDAAATRFGSGWAWLYITGDKKLKTGSTANQDNPLMNVSEVRGFPILGLDVWEHAYYLKYQNKRAEYIENWWQIVNWDYVNDRLGAAS